MIFRGLGITPLLLSNFEIKFFMKHFIAIHRFHTNETQKEYCMSPDKKIHQKQKVLLKNELTLQTKLILKLSVVLSGMVTNYPFAIGKQTVSKTFLIGLKN
jgi:hypothetical protein